MGQENDSRPRVGKLRIPQAASDQSAWTAGNASKHRVSQSFGSYDDNESYRCICMGMCRLFKILDCQLWESSSTLNCHVGTLG
jgi:hypothetical protein